VNIGYACLTVGVLNTQQKSCIMKNASDERLLHLISYNLNSLENIIDYNIANSIKLFRISSDLIPFGSSSVNKLAWWDIFSDRLRAIGKKANEHNIRLSMHPGQYTVLNSPNDDVVERAIADLNYHTMLLDSMGLCDNHKIVLHIGGVYDDKKQAVSRFITNFGRLNEQVKHRLVIENDDRSFNISDILEISELLSIPSIFDNLHNKINPYNNKGDFYWIMACKNTWKEKDGCQKIHYSQQDPLKKPGAHSNSVDINVFMEFYNGLDRKDIDIMLEVKDKNLSAVKCINTTSEDKKIKALELEWSRYKYLVLENSPTDYLEIRKLLKNKNAFPAIEFYRLIEHALQNESIIGNSINTALHIWGYFKKIASNNEKERFSISIEMYKQGKIPIRKVKNILWNMVIKYKQTYLLNSYYFTDLTPTIDKELNKKGM